MSLVEKALQKAQAANRLRQPPSPERVIVGKVVVTEHPNSEQVDSRWRAKSQRVVHIDRDALRSAGLMPAQDQERELADQYRAIKRPLIRAAFEAASEGNPAQLIMMGSALPGDGKTFTCVNLALSMALEKDYSVLLVDGDVAKPHISRVFGVDREPGLLDVLSDPSIDVESVILNTDIPRLSILPAGTRSATSTELLASARMRSLAERLVSLNRRGLVMMDSPPILLTSEARVLASLAGQIVLVVKAGHTPQQAVQDSIEVLGEGKNIKLVLNQADVSGPMGYYYGYRYGYQTAETAAPGDNQSE